MNHVREINMITVMDAHIHGKYVQIYSVMQALEMIDQLL